jgi:serine/threonine protein kinase
MADQGIIITVLAAVLGACLATLLFVLISGRKRREAGTAASPTRLGPYRNLSLLSEKGGMAKIYKAYNGEANRECVLKVLRSDLLGDADAVKKFGREGELLSKINKRFPEAPVVKIFATGTIKTALVELPFIEMQYIPGNTDLSDYLKKNGSLAPEVAEKVLVQTIRALAAGHEMGVIHRDLKPGNILLWDGDPEKVVVCDFGVAKEVDSRSVTLGGYGTAAYMAPEQCSAGGKITSNTDIYALGIIFCELLTGKPVFSEENPFVLMKQHQEGDPAPFVMNVIPQKYQSLILAMLSKDPADRPQIADILSELSTNALEVRGYTALEVADETSASAPITVQDLLGSRKVQLATLASLLVLLIAVSVLVYTKLRPGAWTESVALTGQGEREAEAERKRLEALAREAADRERLESLAKEKADRERREKVARERADRERREKLAKEKADREHREKLAREKADRERLEKLAREKADRERREKLAREKAERERREKLAREKADRERREERAREEAEQERNQLRELPPFPL